MIELTHSQHAIPALDWIFERPVFKSSDMAASSTVSRPTAHRIINLLKSDGILKVVEESRGSRPALLAYTELLEITEGRNPF